ncbi:uncharacterized protein isoform X2 [Rhodnius prolixus]|uniref:uncharacterized protein isoform X2 n=1 Tax=Rhodnius prolixus TaxID=13249 RepID=UPI003D187734
MFVIQTIANEFVCCLPHAFRGIHNLYLPTSVLSFLKCNSTVFFIKIICQTIFKTTCVCNSRFKNIKTLFAPGKLPKEVLTYQVCKLRKITKN